MMWEKRGLIFAPTGDYEWNKSHAQVPVADIVNDETWRIYYATRDASNRSTTSFIDVEAGNPQNIIYRHNQPILPFGRPGTFDEHGIMPSSVITMGTKKYLYYIGWSQRKSVPYQNSIGLAISDDGGESFSKFSEGPVIGVNHIDPFFTGTIFVLKEGGLLRAYYLSCIGWKFVNEKPESMYVLKYATSTDGVNWQRDNIVAIAFKNEDEGGLVSASVVKLNNSYYMWYGYRNYFDFRDNPDNGYRIGLAESVDGVNWIRNDEQSGITRSESGWDSEMVSYPYLLPINGKYYMFYNGNHFGKTGFGYATLNLK